MKVSDVADDGVELVLKAEDDLGEGPVWAVREQALYRTDIKGHAVHRWNPATGDRRTWRTPAEVGCLALRERGGAVVALRNGFHLLDLDSGTLRLIGDPEPGRDGNRFNDGKCDRLGRFWAGTMEDTETHPNGALWVLWPDGRIEQRLAGITCSNGIGWSPDGHTMYYTDSRTDRISAYDFDPDTATLSAPRVVVEEPPSCQWVPDGLTVDAEGYLWSCKWDGWRVVRYAPDGSIDRVLPMPVARPTSCTFGGPDLGTLYITSARTGFSEAQLACQPLAGSVFAARPGVCGLPEPLFAG